MTKQDWSNPQHYEYLTDKTADNWAKGWAWEFIRRSESYRAAYASFDWHKNQKTTVAFPPKLDGESDAAWRMRAADMGYIAEHLTASQVCARQWMLRELYDPELPYSKLKQTSRGVKEHVNVVFDAPDYYPRIYGKATPDNTEILELEYLQAELKHPINPNVAYIALDLSRPLKWQLERVRPIVQKHFGDVDKGSGKQGHQGKWVSYIRILDAIYAGETNMTVVAAEVGVKVSETNGGNKVGKASQYKKAALQMAAEGYKGLLDKIRHRAA